MKISVIIAASGNILPELPALIHELASQGSRDSGVALTVIVASSFDMQTAADFQRMITGFRCRVVHDNTEESAGYFRNINRGLQAVKNSDIVVCANDDIVVPSNFIEKLKLLPLDRPILYAPLVVDTSGRIQLSVRRKSYSKSAMFFRLYDDGLYSKFAERLNLLRSTDLNSNRSTVYGCCFFLNALALNDIHNQLDASIFLYYEEVYLSYLVKKFSWDCRVVDDIVVSHLGGGTTSKNHTMLRSVVDEKSALYVARKYLDFNPVQLFCLKCYKRAEAFARCGLATLRRRNNNNE